MSVKDLDTEYMGWRGWGISHHGDLLGFNGSVWRPGANRALCTIHPNHKPPVEKCDCGWYGTYTYSPHRGSIHGLFIAWGKTAAHYTEFRAEYVEVLCLIENPVFHDEIQRAAEYYEVPVFKDVASAIMYGHDRGLDFIPEDRRPKEAHTLAKMKDDVHTKYVTWEGKVQADRQIYEAQYVSKPSSLLTKLVTPVAITATIGTFAGIILAAAGLGP